MERGGRKGKREGKLKKRWEEGEEGRGALARQKGRERGKERGRGKEKGEGREESERWDGVGRKGE